MYTVQCMKEKEKKVKYFSQSCKKLQQNKQISVNLFTLARLHVKKKSRLLFFNNNWAFHMEAVKEDKEVKYYYCVTILR